MLDGLPKSGRESEQKQQMSKDRPATLHDRILNEVRENILSGHWPPGYRIPFEIEMAAAYGVSRMTVNKVLTQLSREGYLDRRRKGGTLVARPRGQSAVMQIADIGEEVRSRGATYSFTLLRCAERASDAETQPLLRSLAPDRPLLDLEYVHIADGAPFCHEQRLISLDAVPTAAKADFSREQAGAWLLRQVPWSTAEHVIRAVSAPLSVARHLGIAPSVPCLEVTRRTAFEERPVTFARLTYPGDAHQLVAVFSPQSSFSPPSTG